MAKQRVLMKKIAKTRREVETSVKGGFYDKADQREEVMATSAGAQGMGRAMVAKRDASWGAGVVGDEPRMAKAFEATTFDRFDFGVSDFGVRMVLSAGLISGLGLKVGDKIQVLEGSEKGSVLEIAVVVDGTTLRFADDASKGVESNIRMSARLSSLA